MKRLVLGVLAALCAMLAFPVLASARSAHLDKVPESSFTLVGGASEWTRAAGAQVSATTTTGTGTFESTTAGTVKLTFHHRTILGLFNCTTAGQPSGTVTSTELPFHLVILETNKPGILITPGANGQFLSYNCGMFIGPVVWRGNGVLGTLTSPECGKSSNTASLKLEGSAGVQSHLNYTDTTYTLESSVNGGEWVQSAITAQATLAFGGGESRSIICTH